MKATKLIALLVGTSCAALAAAPPAPQGVITARAFTGIGGDTVANLTNSAKFINNEPDVVTYLPYFEWNATGDIYTPPGDWGDDYGVQIVGYFYPPSDGEYWFYICSDDQSVLYLSTDENPANKKLIAMEPVWNGTRNYEGTDRRNPDNPENCSATFLGTEWPERDPVMGGAKIELKAGKAYYIEALMKEAGGGDNLSVAVFDMSGVIPSMPGALIPIPGEYLATIDKSSGPPVFVVQLESQTVNEGESVTFSVEVDGTPPYTYQWYRDGNPIPDATNATYTIPFVLATDDGAKFKVEVTNNLGTRTSEEVVLTVIPDTQPPAVADIGSDEPTSVFVVFDEPVEQTSAENPANYQIQDGPAVTAAVFQPDGQTVRLTTGSPLAEGQWYTLVINGVKDQSVAGNATENLEARFRGAVFTEGVVKYERWEGYGMNHYGGDVSAFNDDLQNGSLPPPTAVAYLPIFDAPAGVADQYGGRLSCWFIPPQTGNYVFFMESDDHGFLYLSTDNNPANKKVIAQESSWADQYWFVEEGEEERRSDMFADTEWPSGNVITLQAGQRYWLELLWLEGGGGDHASATFKLEGEPDPRSGFQESILLKGGTIGTYVDATISEVEITKQPKSVTVLQNRPATFTVKARGVWRGGTTPLYQWQRAEAGSTNFVDIVGAAGDTYTIPHTSMADNGAQFRVKVWVPGEVVYSDVVTLTVEKDTEPPKLVSAGVLKGGQIVGVEFDELVDPTTAQNIANYTVSGVTVNSATVLTNLGNVVRLDVSGPINGPFTVTVKNVRDIFGNAMGSMTVDGVVSPMISVDVGEPGVNPVEPGWAVTWNGKDFYVVGGGHDIWDTEDTFHFVYQVMEGDFDLAVRIEAMDGPQWYSHVDFHVRKPDESGKPKPPDPNINILAYRPDWPNEVWFDWRPSRGADSDSSGIVVQPGYPNCWLRLKRTGTVIAGYHSNDGYHWTKLDEIDTATQPGFEPFEGPLLVGLAVCVYDNTPGEVAWGIFRDFGPTPQALPSIESITLDENGNVVIEFTGILQQADQVGGPYEDIPDATSPYVVTPTGKAKFFRARGQQ